MNIIQQYALKMHQLSTYLTVDCLGGPKPWKLAWIINFQKAGTLLFVLALMYWYQNFSSGAWIYLALHGGYGLVWIIKDLNFPDPNWQKRVTIAGGLNAFLLVLMWYWFFAWLLISAESPPNYPLNTQAWYALCIILCLVGSVLMIAADAQKYYTLKVKKGLIQEGLHRYIRHPNYLGEMMIYLSFALMVWQWLPFLILSVIWLLVFSVNMTLKELSLSRYSEWAAYKKSSWWLIPFVL